MFDSFAAARVVPLAAYLLPFPATIRFPVEVLLTLLPLIGVGGGPLDRDREDLERTGRPTPLGAAVTATTSASLTSVLMSFPQAVSHPVLVACQRMYGCHPSY